MGSPLRLQVPVGVPAAIVDAAWREVVDEFEATEQVLSRFRETSEIHRLRLAGGQADDPSRRLVAALTAADRARRVTRGRFDPRVLGDLERLGWRPLAIAEAADGSRPGTPPAAADRSAAIFSRAGRRGPIEVPVPVDFGGIGKGLALRWAARRAAAALAGRPYLLEAGGDIVASGAPPGHGWRVGIERPGGEGAPADDAPLVVVELPAAGGAIATSSVRIGHWQTDDGREVHHLIDPRTGEPGGAGLRSVTVRTDDAAWAEVWSKALFLEGASGIAAVARARGLAAWWVSSEGAVEMTPAARAETIWVEAEAA